MLRLLTAGESHGQGLVAILEGFPAGVPLTLSLLDQELSWRRLSAGRSARMKKEKDSVEILSGLRAQKTLGSPIAFFIPNEEWQQWRPFYEGKSEKLPKIEAPRPGHADLPGWIKYRTDDLREIWERASGRETVARVAAGHLCLQFLQHFDIVGYAHTLSVGSVRISTKIMFPQHDSLIKKSPLLCGDPKSEIQMLRLIEQTKKSGDTLGGIFEIQYHNLPPGLGSYVHPDRRLDARIAFQILSIPGIKGVEIGEAFEGSRQRGSQVHDEIHYEAGKNIFGFYRQTNRGGGLEGGMTNGEPLLIRGAMKPLPTLRSPLKSINVRTKKAERAAILRGDTCSVPAASIVAKSVIALELMQAFLEKFGGDNFWEIKQNYQNFISNPL